MKRFKDLIPGDTLYITRYLFDGAQILVKRIDEVIVTPIGGINFYFKDFNDDGVANVYIPARVTRRVSYSACFADVDAFIERDLQRIKREKEKMNEAYKNECYVKVIKCIKKITQIKSRMKEAYYKKL